MTRLEALTALNMVFDIGSVRLSKLLEYFGKPESILNAPAEKLTRVFGIGEKIAAKIVSLKKVDLSREFASAEKSGLKIITMYDKDYPENLKNIPGAPLVLYVKGELKPEDKLSVGIIGSRRATFYGISAAERFASELAVNGFTIVSGMARGIDTYAHKGALKVMGRTIAVIGSGFGHIYPLENKELAEEISKSGAVISEFPIDTKPLSQNFPRRNRVISGLSLGVLVVEAARNSGALITADFALEQGREVFAVPGKVDSGNSFGTNELIKQGAKLVSCAEDILEEFIQPADKNASVKETPEINKTRGLSDPDEYKVYELIREKSIQLDDLVQEARLDIPRLSDILLRLRIKKLVQELPGKQYIRSS
ncbi:MAG: DNA-processing protein DprA [Candidatus Omnitrophota bacterium]